ncbi:hypothetical protein JQC91_06390 [Jannaschia sp. Os4]|uniref:hypothetical protein n=1 Tax=Jannaschia sp. Os4 TaxID=2807617 RepID=UPI0019396B8C|nr:hypothetical protein [Jannaschia sp. Os4]MBM2575926.1 hypothetical protein [Jannaschia sp. Os4]
MKPVLHRLACAAFLAAAPVAAGAATLGVFTHDYGNGTSGTAGVDDYTPNGSYTTLEADHAFFNNDSNANNVFAFDSFDLSSLSGATIESIDFTLEFNGANTAPDGEQWYFDIYGSDPSTYTDNRWQVLPDDGDPIDVLTFTLDASTDTGGIDAFSHILNTMELAFGFEEATASNPDWLSVYSASITVYGSPEVVPLPATGVLLLGALAWLGWRRRDGASPADGSGAVA